MSKSGRPLPPDVRASRSETQLLQNINRSIRSDWGGKVPTEAVLTKLQGLKSESLLAPCDRLAEFIVELVRDQVEGIRARTSHDREELMRRTQLRIQKENGPDHAAARESDGLLAQILARIERLEKSTGVV